MAKTRIVNTRFWIDDYTSNLDPTEKLLFLYFLTNTATEICGVYEIPLKVVAVETGIDKEMVEKILKRFENDKKMFYIDGWVWITNFTKHQIKNPSVEQGIERCFKEVPKEINVKVSQLLQSGDSLGTDSPQPGLLNLTKLNLTKLNLSEATPLGVAGKDISEIINLFKPINPSYKKFFSNKTQRGAVERMLKEHGEERIKNLLEKMPQYNIQKYMPVITTPLQLEDKMASLIFLVKKEENNNFIVKI